MYVEVDSTDKDILHIRFNKGDWHELQYRQSDSFWNIYGAWFNERDALDELERKRDGYIDDEISIFRGLIMEYAHINKCKYL